MFILEGRSSHSSFTLYNNNVTIYFSIIEGLFHLSTASLGSPMIYDLVEVCVNSVAMVIVF